MLLHTTPQEEGEHRVRQVETRQRKNKKTETKQKTNKETVPGRSLVYVMVVSLSHASRSFPKIFVPHLVISSLPHSRQVAACSGRGRSVQEVSGGAAAAALSGGQEVQRR